MGCPIEVLLVPDFWLDSDSLIERKEGPYGFDIAPGFWRFLEQEMAQGIIGSSTTVYTEIDNGSEDDLLLWAKKQKDSGFFVEPDALVKNTFRQIAQHVSQTYPQHQSSVFLNGADPWIISHARTYGGKVVTFEIRAPLSKKPKIPDVCQHFQVRCLNVY